MEASRKNVITEHIAADNYLTSIKDFVKEYTRRDLTNPNDIYSAILGAYNRLHNLQRSWGRGVIAGLPVLAFDQTLAWLPMTSPSRRLTSDNTSVPQWTWAAHNGSVRLFWVDGPNDIPPLITDVHIHTTSGLRIHLPTALIDVADTATVRKKLTYIEPQSLEEWVEALRQTLPDLDLAAIETAKQDIITHKRALMQHAQKLEFRSTVATLWIAPRRALTPGKTVWKGVFYDTVGGGHEVAPILTADGVWAGTLRLPTEVMEEIIAEGVPRKMEFVAVLRETMLDNWVADGTAWLGCKEMVRPVPSVPDVGEIVVVLAVERGKEGMVRWAVGAVVKAAWVQAGAREEVVFLV